MDFLIIFGLSLMILLGAFFVFILLNTLRDYLTERMREWKANRRNEAARRDVAQVIHNSFYAMEAGEWPSTSQQTEPNAGDMQLASDILKHFTIKEKN